MLTEWAAAATDLPARGGNMVAGREEGWGYV